MTFSQWLIAIAVGACALRITWEYVMPRMGKYSLWFRALHPYIKEVLIGVGEDGFPPIYTEKTTDAKCVVLTPEYLLVVNTKGFFDRYEHPRVVVRKTSDGSEVAVFTENEEQLIYHMITKAHRKQEEKRKAESDRISERKRVEKRTELEDNLPD
jgi:hypothetical protein